MVQRRSSSVRAVLAVLIMLLVIVAILVTVRILARCGLIEGRGAKADRARQAKFGRTRRKRRAWPDLEGQPKAAVSAPADPLPIEQTTGQSVDRTYPMDEPEHEIVAHEESIKTSPFQLSAKSDSSEQKSISLRVPPPLVVVVKDLGAKPPLAGVGPPKEPKFCLDDNKKEKFDRLMEELRGPDEPSARVAEPRRVEKRCSIAGRPDSSSIEEPPRTEPSEDPEQTQFGVYETNFTSERSVDSKGTRSKSISIQAELERSTDLEGDGDVEPVRLKLAKAVNPKLKTMPTTKLSFGRNRGASAKPGRRQK